MARFTRNATSNNERTFVNSAPDVEEVRGDQLATGQKREGASRRSNPLGLSHPAKTPMPAALRSPQRRTPSPLGLSHPARTPMPGGLRTALASPIVGSGSGARRLVGAKSAYAVRAERKGQLIGLVEILVSVRDGIHAGRTLLDGVATGTLWGWRARITLSSVLDVPLADWDNAPGRTQLERLAVVERALAECGLVETTRRGGWAVSSSSKR